MAMGTVQGQVGQRLTAEVAAQSGGAPLTGASAAGLASPINITSTVYHPLPNGTGSGLSAFYYALLLLLAGFTGSIVVSTLVDALLGYVPAEFGPVYRFAEQVQISRLQALLVKWAMMVLLALLTSAVYLAIGHGLGMPVGLGWQVWAFGVFAITAVGVTSSSLLSVLGSTGLLVSMLIFVILGLPSAGATVPLEAVPPLFRWLAEFEPMHQVFLGARSLLYLDGPGRRRLVPGAADDVDRSGDRAAAGRHCHTRLRPQGFSPHPRCRRAGDRRGAPGPTPGATNHARTAPPRGGRGRRQKPKRAKVIRAVGPKGLPR